MRTSLHATAALAAIVVSVASVTSVAFAQISVQGSVGANTAVGQVVNGTADVSVGADVKTQAATSTTVVSGTVQTSASVDTEADEQLTQTIQVSDANVTEVSTDDDSVTVAYKVPGRFLGLFPVDTTVYVTSDASGTTRVHYPWYTFVTSVNDDSLKADLEARNWAVTSSNKAEVATSIQSALKAWASANASADTTVDN